MDFNEMLNNFPDGAVPMIGTEFNDSDFLDTFEKRLDYFDELKKRNLKMIKNFVKEKEMSPYAILVSEKTELYIPIGLVIKDDIGVREFTKIIRVIAKKFNAFFAMLCTEAWMVKCEKDKYDPEISPSKHPDKMEVVTVTSYLYDAAFQLKFGTDVLHTMYEIQNVDDERIIKESTELNDTKKGTIGGAVIDNLRGTDEDYEDITLN